MSLHYHHRVGPCSTQVHSCHSLFLFPSHLLLLLFIRMMSLLELARKMYGSFRGTQACGFFFLLFFCEQQMLLSNLSSRLKSTSIIGAEVGWNKLWTGIWTVIINYVDLFEGDDGTLDAIYTTEAILSISMGHPIDKNGMMSWLFMMILNSKATNGIWVWQHHQLFEVQWVDAFCH